MSDTPRMARWWQASDGKWYPPEQHPNYRPPAPPPPVAKPLPKPPSAATSTMTFDPRKQPPGDGRAKRWWHKFRGLPTWAQAAIWIVLAIIIIAAAASPKKDKKETVASSQPSTTIRPTSTAAPITGALATTPPATTRPATTQAGPKTTFGNGQYRVGTDIAAGTYVAPGGSNCYWERQRTFGGSGVGDIIANDLSSGGQVVVTIAASDIGFKTSGCGTWRPG